MGVIIFNGVSSQDYGIQVESVPGYSYPERDYEQIRIPGRNGDLFIDHNAYKNVTKSYELAVGDNTTNFIDVATKLSTWLHSTSGYARLEDSYEPDYFRIAAYVEEGLIENIFAKAGRCEVTFSCKPQRFLKSGEEAVTFLEDGTILNPTVNTSLPIIRVYGTGEVGIGSETITILKHPASIPYIDIDCDLSDAVYNSVNCNSYVKLTSESFPVFSKGSTGVTLGSGITKIEITPRWWSI